MFEPPKGQTEPPEEVELVSVLASFHEHRIRPIVFRWGQKKYHVDRLNLAYRRRDGRRLYYHFAVTVGVDTFDLCFDPEALEWRLWRGPEG